MFLSSLFKKARSLMFSSVSKSCLV
ncbi:hypothetical protein BCEN4_740119 [Burkholderia cenocepacia]|nr:hypothetical protein BCEN4_740119 [Burkholderia cenocepacia]